MSMSRQIRRAEARRAAKEARRQGRLRQHPDSDAFSKAITDPANRDKLKEVDHYLDEMERLLNLPPLPPPAHMAREAGKPAERTGPTGPRSVSGKAKSSLNNLKHGLTGSFRVMEFESQSEFDELARSLRDEHKPEGTTEELLVRKMVEHLWLSRRAQMLLDVSLNDGNEREISLYMRYGVTNDRAFSRCLNDLLKLRREKRAAAKEFELQKAKATETQVRVRLANARSAALELKNEHKRSRLTRPAVPHTTATNAPNVETELATAA